MLDGLTIGEMLARAGVAAALGGAIGWDRELRSKAAGLRTMMLVSLGAAGFVMATLQLANAANNETPGTADPIRVINGIVGGIGFLGAGSIIQSRGNIRGMTTAATVWAAAAIGIACGLGEFILALVLSGFALAMLVVVTPLKGRLFPDKHDLDEEEAEEALSEARAAKGREAQRND